MDKNEPMTTAREGTCRRRMWILETLSDDEVIESDGALPPAVQFHLAQCPSCRRDADMVLAALGGLGSLGCEELPAGLADQADARVFAALDRGADLTGRTPDTIEEIDGGIGLAVRGPRWAQRLAVAAALFAAVIWAGSGLLERESPRYVDRVPTGHSGSEPDHRGVYGPSSSEGETSSAAVANGQPTDQPTRLCPDQPLDFDGLPEDANCIFRAFTIAPRAIGNEPQPPGPTTTPPPEAKAIKGGGN